MLLLVDSSHCNFISSDMFSLGYNSNDFYFIYLFFFTDAAGNFLCPASSLSFNAFKTVMEIDTMGTFNTSKVVYEKWFQVGSADLKFFIF